VAELRELPHLVCGDRDKWLNHDRMFQLIHRSDHDVVLANLFLLLAISAIPFPTKVVGDELNRGTFADQRTATILYGVTFVAASIAFPLLWHAACRGGGRLLAPDLPDESGSSRHGGTCSASPSSARPPWSRCGARLPALPCSGR